MSHFQSIFRYVVFCVVAGSIIDADGLSAQSATGSNSVIEFPYQAIVRNEGTEIFSGPAAVHYATDRIDQGEIVQVYRHDPGGWCAIRPNPGSFSLIPAAAVEIVDDGIGEILQDNTQAWVGTRLGSVEKPLWQIKLKAGEEVEILGEASWPSPDGSSTIWYQVAPPAGEFRWVRFADLNTPPTNTDPVADSNTRTPQTPDATAVSKLARNSPADQSVNPTHDDDRLNASPSNVTDSGFTYVDRAEGEIRNGPQSVLRAAAPANSKPTLDAASGFKYVAANQSKPRPVRSIISQSNDLNNNKDQNAAGRVDRAAGTSQWTRAQSNSVATNQPVNRNRQSQTPPSPNPAPTASYASASEPASTAPQPDQQAMDFKFRPIGQSATIAGSFASNSEPSRPDRDADIMVDSAVSPAAFQSPISSRDQRFDDQRHDDQRFDDGGWQRGRSEIAQRRSQYESKYDQFNQRDRFDHRDVEASFGVQWEELPEHRRAADGRYDGRFDIGRSNGSGNYPASIENSSPPYDRYASLTPEFDTIGRSTLAEKLTTRLAKVEQELTNEMLKRPNEWQLADLELNVGQIYSQTTHPMERLQSQRILDKIKKCKIIRNGYTKNFQATGETFGTSVRSLKDARGLAIASDPQFGVSANAATPINGLTDPRTGRPSLGRSFLSGPDPVIGSGIDTDFELNARFDAVGWMTELVSEDRNNRPVYVLVNQSGEITHHVAGVPGLNLHRYLKSKVGIIGRRGYNNRMKLDHITAQSIDELQQNR